MKKSKIGKLLTKIVKTIEPYFWAAVIFGLLGWFLYEVPGKWIYEKTYSIINSEKIKKAEIQLDNGRTYFAKKDYKKAFDYFQNSANNGNIEAQGVLATFYLCGIEGYIQQDHKKSLELLNNVEKKEKTPNTEYLIGTIYKTGYGATQDQHKAFDWFYKSAGAGFWTFFNDRDENGDPRAQYELALMYKNGEGVKPNIKKSEKWFFKCGETACKYGYNFLTNKDTANALDMFQIGVEVENADAQSTLGLWYLYGRYVKTDYKKALDLLTKSISQEEENAAAYRGLGEIYLMGYDVVEKNDVKALEFYKMAAEQGDKNAKEVLQKIDIKQ
jgi:uncharacterized protein